jgi:hypothetical protein
MNKRRTMRLYVPWFPDRRPTLLMLAVLIILAVPPIASPATFTVNRTTDFADAIPGDGRCETAPGNGLCTLRAAIEESNALQDQQSVINLPAGTYTLTRGSLVITDGVIIRGARSIDTIIDGDHRSGVLEVGTVLYSQTLDQGTANGALVPRAVATALDDFPNCLAAEGCLGKQPNVDVGGSDPIPPISFDFSLTPAQVAAVTGSPGRGVLTVTASRDIGHKIGMVTGDVVPATVDGTRVGDLFRDTIDTCPPDENFAPINFFCGPNFHNDFPGTDSLFVNQGTFQASAGNGTVRVILSPVGSPVGGDPRLGVGRFKVFAVRLMYVKDLLVTLSGFTIRNGTDSGIRNDGGFVQGFDLVVRDNATFSQGGGIFNNLGTVTLRDSTISGNDGGARAGGIANTNLGILALDRCTVSDNRATQGGGILNSGQLSILNSTVSHNIAELGGGGIQNTGTADITFSTITGNIANDRREFSEAAVGGGIRNALDGQINIGNTILAGNTDNRSGFADQSPDCFSTLDFHFTSFRGNLVGVLNANCILKDTIFGNTAFDVVGTPAAPINPRLGPLADNGGPTLTHALLRGSPAIDQGTGVTSATFFDCPETDQRGFSRPVDGDGDGRAACDIGAYEFGALPPEISFQDGVSPTPAYAGTRDTYIAEDQPTTNFCSVPTLRVDGDDPPGTERDVSTLLQWDLSTIPAGSKVQSATITINVTNPTGGTYELYRIASPWEECQVTWDTRPSTGMTVRGTVGPTSTGTHTITLHNDGVALVQSWIDGSTPNYGLMIAASDVPDGLAFDSREASPAFNHPRLTITFE